MLMVNCASINYSISPCFTHISLNICSLTFLLHIYLFLKMSLLVLNLSSLTFPYGFLKNRFFFFWVGGGALFLISLKFISFTFELYINNSDTLDQTKAYKSCMLNLLQINSIYNFSSGLMSNSANLLTDFTCFI